MSTINFYFYKKSENYWNIESWDSKCSKNPFTIIMRSRTDDVKLLKIQALTLFFTKMTGSDGTVRDDM